MPKRSSKSKFKVLTCRQGPVQHVGTAGPRPRPIVSRCNAVAPAHAVVMPALPTALQDPVISVSNRL